jgi:large subunit ribosomal protein L29
MANKKYEKIQSYSEAELTEHLKELKANYNQMQLEHTVKGLEDPLSMRNVRRDVARMQTEVRRRELEKASEAELSKRTKIRSRRRKK